MQNKTFDLLKSVAQIWLPMSASIIIGVGEIWGLEVMAPIGATITLIDTALGVALAKLSKDYHKEQKEVEG